MKLRLKEIRSRCGLSQQEVSERVGMPVRRYGSYERGERTLSLIDAARIADVFQCTLDELAGRKWPKDSPALTVEEGEIIACYRDTNDQGRAAIEAVARSQSGTTATCSI